MAREIREHTFLALVGVSLSIIVATFIALLWEPQPYRYIKVTAGPMYEQSDILPVDVDIFRTESCPYVIERTVYDANNHKRFDSREIFSAPQVVGGSEQFGADVHLDTQPDVGQGVYSARIGTMCNPVQRMFPNWGKGWFNIPFTVLPTPKSSRPSG